MVLSRNQAKDFYDRFGKKQDAQAFYEDAALDDLVIHGAFEQVENIFELGCGTGRFASQLLTKHLSSSAVYLGVDLSQTMINIAEQRISAYSERAQVVQSDDALKFPLSEHSVDRVVSTYVFDLLSESELQQPICEAHRVLIEGGKLCLVSLTIGDTFVSRIVSALWSILFRLHARLVGGCRPIWLESLFDPHDWVIEYRNVVIAFGVPSEVLIAVAKKTAL